MAATRIRYSSALNGTTMETSLTRTTATMAAKQKCQFHFNNQDKNETTRCSTLNSFCFWDYIRSSQNNVSHNWIAHSVIFCMFRFLYFRFSSCYFSILLIDSVKRNHTIFVCVCVCRDCRSLPRSTSVTNSSAFFRFSHFCKYYYCLLFRNGKIRHTRTQRTPMAMASERKDYGISVELPS